MTLSIDEKLNIMNENISENKDNLSKLNQVLLELSEIVKLSVKSTEEFKIKIDERNAKADEEIAKANEQIAKANERIAKMDEEIAEMRKERKEYSKKIDERNAKADEQIAKANEQIAKMDEEIAEIRKERKEYSKKIDEQIKHMNKEWGNLANSLGIVVEALILPNFEFVLKKFFNESSEDIVYQAINILKSKRSDSKYKKEFDLIVVTHKNFYVVESKTSIGKEYVMKLSEVTQPEIIFDYFPEYKDRQIIPIMGTSKLSSGDIALLNEYKIFALSIYGDILTIENFNDLKKNYNF